MSRTSWPAWAIAIATLVAVVDLPSPGIELVTTKTLLPASMSTNWRFVRSTRNASTRGAWELSELTRGVRVVLASKAMPPRTGASTTASTSCTVFTEVSSSSRITAMARPSSRPRIPPSKRLRRGLGEIGSVGRVAGPTTVPLRFAVFLPGSVSICSIRSSRVETTCLLIACAIFGSASTTWTLSSTVSGTTCALILRESCRRREVEVHLVDDPLRQLAVGDQLRVGGDLLGRRQTVLVRVAAGAVLRHRGGAGRDEDAGVGGVLRSRPHGDQRRHCQGGHDAADDHGPATTENAQIVAKLHNDPLVGEWCRGGGTNPKRKASRPVRPTHGTRGRLQPDRDRSVVDERHLHVRAEDPLLHRHAERGQFACTPPRRAARRRGRARRPARWGAGPCGRRRRA